MALHWLGRQLRGLRPDRNPLRRGTDRAETYLLAALFTAVAVSTPITAELASHAAWQSALQVQREQKATRTLVVAHLSESTGSAAAGYALTETVPAYATWTSVTGARRSGLVPARADKAKGTAVKIYIDDRTGSLVLPPLTIEEATNEADAAGVGAVVGVAVVALVGAAAIRQVLYRRRMADWEADWAVTARTWNRQRG
jgi:hypothetical protein